MSCCAWLCSSLLSELASVSRFDEPAKTLSTTGLIAVQAPKVPGRGLSRLCDCANGRPYYFHPWHRFGAPLLPDGRTTRATLATATMRRLAGTRTLNSFWPFYHELTAKAPKFFLCEGRSHWRDATSSLPTQCGRHHVWHRGRALVGTPSHHFPATRHAVRMQPSARRTWYGRNE